MLQGKEVLRDRGRGLRPAAGSGVDHNAARVTSNLARLKPERTSGLDSVSHSEGRQRTADATLEGRAGDI